MRLIMAITCLLLSGCSSNPGKAVIGKAKSLFGDVTPKVEVANPTNAEKPAEVRQGESKVDVVVNPGAEVDLPLVVNEVPVVAKVRLPEFKVSKIERTTEASVSPPRAPDKSVELRKADNAERRILLYAAIASLGLGVLFVFLKYPTPAILCGGAGALFFAAWHLSGERWLMNVAIGALVLGGAVYFIWEQAEKRSKQDAAQNE